MAVEDIPGFTFPVFQTDSVPDEVFRQVQGVFAENYRDANQSYLEKNLGKLRFLSVATAADGRLAAFAMGESRVIDLPRLPASRRLRRARQRHARGFPGAQGEAREADPARNRPVYRAGRRVVGGAPPAQGDARRNGGAAWPRMDR